MTAAVFLCLLVPACYGCRYSRSPYALRAGTGLRPYPSRTLSLRDCCGPLPFTKTRASTPPEGHRVTCIMFQPQSPQVIHKPRCLKHDHAFPCQYLCLRHPFIPPLKHTHGLKSQIWCFSHTVQLVRARAKARKQRFFAPGDAAARTGAKKGR